MAPIYPILAIIMLWLAAYTDLTRRLIRNWVSLTLLLLFILYAVFPVQPLHIRDHMLWAGGLFVLLLTGFIFGKVGGGDVKLATAVMLWVGPKAGPEFLIITALCGGLLALFIIMPTLRLMREWALTPFLKHGMITDEGAAPTVPYGVAIAAGGTVALYSTYLKGMG
ncbi:prepilin peptidase [Sneathiella sp.]|uniref:A24 family peptidase n=1 Tax=Sneathiella sp. TaxID=1964365 RepID=UPI00262E0BDF|nr:prepilin peptidase [Sneathiella sp.]MDF2367182.1 prepilin peptidase [Sneathiella sp.]